jgi:hypothetical protein
MTWLRASYWIGAAVDAVNAVAMLNPRWMALPLGIEPPPSGVEVRAALAMASALMLGWTALLIWGSRRPVERRGVLLLTVCPVIVGLALTTGYAFAAGYVPGHGALSVWAMQAVLCGIFLSAHRRAAALARRGAGERAPAPLRSQRTR